MNFHHQLPMNHISLMFSTILVFALFTIFYFHINTAVFHPFLLFLSCTIYLCTSQWFNPFHSPLLHCNFPLLFFHSYCYHLSATLDVFNFSFFFSNLSLYSFLLLDSDLLIFLFPVLSFGIKLYSSFVQNSPSISLESKECLKEF